MWAGRCAVDSVQPTDAAHGPRRSVTPVAPTNTPASPSGALSPAVAAIIERGQAAVEAINASSGGGDDAGAGRREAEAFQQLTLTRQLLELVGAQQWDAALQVRRARGARRPPPPLCAPAALRRLPRHMRAGMRVRMRAPHSADTGPGPPRCIPLRAVRAQVLAQLSFVPSERARIEACKAEARRLDDAVRQRLGDVLEAAASALVGLRSRADSAMLGLLRERAECLKVRGGG